MEGTVSRSLGKQLHIAIGSRSRVICGNVEIADQFVTRFVGLLGRKGLAKNTGLWLNPSRGVHTFGMRFAIDVVALDSEMTVVGLHRDLRAWRIAATSSATRSVLELPAGHIDAFNLGLGERLSLRARGEMDVEDVVR